jgi:hypothetical protein
MKFLGATCSLLLALAQAAPAADEPVLQKRGTPQFTSGEPIDANGKGGPILSMLF